MEVKIGITDSPRELSFIVSYTSAEIDNEIKAALESDKKYLVLTDNQGSIHYIPAIKIAYVVVGASERRKVGFVA